MKDNLVGDKSDNLNDELIKEYLENMDKNAEKAIKYVNEKKDENEKINGGGKRKMIFGKMFK